MRPANTNLCRLATEGWQPRVALLLLLPLLLALALCARHRSPVRQERTQEDSDPASRGQVRVDARLPDGRTFASAEEHTLAVDEGIAQYVSPEGTPAAFIDNITPGSDRLFVLMRGYDQWRCFSEKSGALLWATKATATSERAFSDGRDLFLWRPHEGVLSVLNGQNGRLQKRVQLRPGLDVRWTARGGALCLGLETAPDGRATPSLKLLMLHPAVSVRWRLPGVQGVKVCSDSVICVSLESGEGKGVVLAGVSAEDGSVLWTRPTRRAVDDFVALVHGAYLFVAEGSSLACTDPQSGVVVSNLPNVSASGVDGRITALAALGDNGVLAAAIRDQGGTSIVQWGPDRNETSELLVVPFPVTAIAVGDALLVLIHQAHFAAYDRRTAQALWDSREVAGATTSVPVQRGNALFWSVTTSPRREGAVVRLDLDTGTQTTLLSGAYTVNR